MARAARLQFPLSVDAGLGRIQESGSYEAYVAGLIRQVLLTGHGQRINRPDFGAGLRGLLFAPNNPGIASLAETVVREALDTWLGSLISTDDVQVRAENELLHVFISYTIRSRGEQHLLNLEVTP